MHTAVLKWLRSVRLDYPGLFAGVRVLECGSRVINGSPRMFWPACQYTGLDAAPGKGVDVVGLAHTYQGGPFDVVVSCEMLEHDPYWRQSVQNMAGLLEPGGALLLSFAGPGRPPHYTDDSPTPGYYENRSAEDVTALIAGQFETVRAETHVEAGGQVDVYILALGKRAAP